VDADCEGRGDKVADLVGCSHGQNPPPRAWLEQRGLRYVLAVPCSQPVAIAAATSRADELAASVPASAWRRHSCGDGTKGPRVYDWAWLGIDHRHTVLVRRSVADRERAYFLCFSPRPVALAQLVRVAGARWAIEECFQAAKNECGPGPLPGPPV
jgi:SRSO17 transposase